MSRSSGAGSTGLVRWWSKPAARKPSALARAQAGLERVVRGVLDHDALAAGAADRAGAVDAHGRAARSTGDAGPQA
jgi:hypothetical protein